MKGSKTLSAEDAGILVEAERIRHRISIENGSYKREIIRGSLYRVLLVSLGAYFGYLLAREYSAPKYENVIGKEHADTFVRKNGVNYFSQIDGKDVSDLVE